MKSPLRSGELLVLAIVTGLTLAALIVVSYVGSLVFRIMGL